MYYEFYIDVFFVVNLLMDFLVLCLTRRLLGETANPKRALAGAAAGAGSICLFILFAGKIHVVKMVIFYGTAGILMVRIGCGFKTLKKLILGTSAFYGASFLLGGILHVLPGTKGRGMLTFTIITVTAYGVVNTGIRLWKYLKEKEPVQCRAVVALNGRKMEVKGLYDTGNCLRDYETGKPVSVMEYGVFAGLLEEEQKKALQQFCAMEDISAREMQPEAAASLRPRFLLYTSVGCSRGLLLVITADSLTVRTGEKEKQIRNAAIGLSQTALSFHGNFQIIISPTILDS